MRTDTADDDEEAGADLALDDERVAVAEVGLAGRLGKRHERGSVEAVEERDAAEDVGLLVGGQGHGRHDTA